ncbi:dephospho-CoA kinase [Calderihabitans maritimus]|uniref:Dephospho-CoA kinase n=1 Tax=Calderihabitans maritimus TaxID=1246530 RepID=A0A1Z5HT07_9FIRM|nr:dephospho-CoA kinase [Calderihabitans maritimus]GAW92400.1 dephospho-CoA kinase [Calderihabitans maritimus]
MFKIGLTGGIGSGKSTVAGILRELGAYVVDADQVAREVVQPGRPAWQEIVEHFGEEILQKDGQIDRKALGRLVFENPEARKKLNQITHPRVVERLLEIEREYRRKDPRGILVLEIPLLIEARLTHLVDEVWVAAADEETQVERVMKRDKLSREEALRRIRAQMPLGEKIKYADRIIDTSGTLADTRRRVERLWQHLQQR